MTTSIKLSLFLHNYILRFMKDSFENKILYKFDISDKFKLKFIKKLFLFIEGKC